MYTQYNNNLSLSSGENMESSTAEFAIEGSDAPTALVSGASFAGLATAYWLHRLGFQVTVVEVAPGLRRGGTPVDIEGESLSVLTRMGLLDTIRAKALPPRRHEFKRIDDTIVLSPQPDSNDEAQQYEVHRNDLLDMLSDAIKGSVEIMFGRSITSLKEEKNSISAVLSDGTSQKYMLAFGCDGNRSKTRNLVFQDGENFDYFMGGYLYSKILPMSVLVPPDTTEIVSLPGLMVMLNGYEDQTDIVFGFRSEGEIEYDHNDKNEQRRLIHKRFDGLGWKVPDMLARVDEDGDFYFDRMTQIRMPSWSRGRFALVGDAGYCVSPFAGFGGSMAIIGAGRMADALTQHCCDHEAAFQAYEDGLRPFVAAVQEHAATDGVLMLIPATEAELAERDQKMVGGEIGPFDSTQA
jgi:2-polyprenyl-6-methoxyphenol hydroxylase-like FAD-dependent oxidoreductase